MYLLLVLVCCFVLKNQAKEISPTVTSRHQNQTVTTVISSFVVNNTIPTNNVSEEVEPTVIPSSQLTSTVNTHVTNGITFNITQTVYVPATTGATASKSNRTIHVFASNTTAVTSNLSPSTNSSTPNPSAIPVTVSSMSDKTFFTTVNEHTAMKVNTIFTTNAFGNETNTTSTNSKVNSSNGLSPAIGVVLGVSSAILIVVLIVIIYRYQRKFMNAFRFRRLQEVPLDDLEDDVSDAVYTDHSNPIRLRV